ncbi:glycosyltransferase family 4 protein [Maribacter sp. MAR_2009_72]|uniref:glycosyltransferase family 4 protein n=1 Tax=Maribacter sp. MAR_2009_72 TaxID=1250050 RepID=UPI001198FCF3|nr:glycosyltransferase family 4 protein [Maribacter sp. MAR_2009_72]TVZ16915.1 glycosyltransferase involved in cell wall biosynthesis [Maribacter sp. MAR_2009_72]
MLKNITVTVPKLTLPGGVSAFWNALFPEFKAHEHVTFTPLEIGGHGKNIFGPLIDIWHLKKATDKPTDLLILNPSLGSRSFFRDAFFAKYLLRKNIPFVLFFHGWNLDFEKRIDEKYVSFFQKSLGKAKKIFVLSEDFKSKLLAWGYKGEVVVSTTMVNRSLFPNVAVQEQEINKSSDFSILFLSRLIKEKGIYETIAAFEKLQGKHKNIELIIAGSGNELEPIRKLVANNDQIVLTGHVEGQKKIALYQNCDVYCLPSYSEGLPTSVLEAMAFGKPVITTPVGGLKSFFKDGTMGYFVHPKQAIDIEDKIAMLMVHPELRKEMGNFNYNFAHEHLLSNKVAQKILQELTPFL